MVVGIMVGSGIFRTPGLVAGQLGRPGLTFVAWALGGLVGLLGALVFAELSTRHPSAGGKYVYAREAFGRRAAFVIGWTEAIGIYCAAIAAIAVVSGEYLARLVAWPAGRAALLGALLVALFTGLNLVGVEAGRWTQGLVDGRQGAGPRRGGRRGRALRVGSRMERAAPGRPHRPRQPRGAGGGLPVRDLELLRLSRRGQDRRGGGRSGAEPAPHPARRDPGHHGALPAAERGLPERAAARRAWRPRRSCPATSSRRCSARGAEASSPRSPWSCCWAGSTATCSSLRGCSSAWRATASRPGRSRGSTAAARRPSPCS